MEKKMEAPIYGSGLRVSGYFFWGGSHNEDDSMLGSILGPYLGKLPYSTYWLLVRNKGT